jgi:hypothetical protein
MVFEGALGTIVVPIVVLNILAVTLIGGVALSSDPAGKALSKQRAAQDLTRAHMKTLTSSLKPAAPLAPPVRPASVPGLLAMSGRPRGQAASGALVKDMRAAAGAVAAMRPYVPPEYEVVAGQPSCHAIMTPVKGGAGGERPKYAFEDVDTVPSPAQLEAALAALERSPQLRQCNQIVVLSFDLELPDKKPAALPDLPYVEAARRMRLDGAVGLKAGLRGRWQARIEADATEARARAADPWWNGVRAGLKLLCNHGVPMSFAEAFAVRGAAVELLSVAVPIVVVPAKWRDEKVGGELHIAAAELGPDGKQVVDDDGKGCVVAFLVYHGALAAEQDKLRAAGAVVPVEGRDAVRAAWKALMNDSEAAREVLPVCAAAERVVLAAAKTAGTKVKRVMLGVQLTPETAAQYKTGARADFLCREVSNLGLDGGVVQRFVLSQYEGGGSRLVHCSFATEASDVYRDKGFSPEFARRLAALAK